MWTIFSLCVFRFAFFAFADTDAPASASADTSDLRIQELQKKIEELTKQSEEYRGTVLQKQQEGDTLKRQIDILNAQILKIQTDLGITEVKISASQVQLQDLEGRIFTTQANIERQKAAIAATVQSLDEHDHVDLLSALMANPSLSDFARQAQQLSVLNARLSTLVQDLKLQKTNLEDQLVSAQKKKTELLSLGKQQANQRVALQGSKANKNNLLVVTKGQEKQYQKLLTEAEKQKAAFFAEMQNLEASAVANGMVVTHVTASAVPKRGTKLFIAPYADKFYISQGFGMTSYARRGAYGGAIHNGTDIVSGYGSPIRPIGSGKVLASGTNKGFGNWIAVQHDAGGGMVSVYGHMMSPTSLRIGTSVDSSSTLGFEGSTGNSTGAHLHLSLYRDFFTYINPKNGQLYFNYANGSVNPSDYTSL